MNRNRNNEMVGVSALALSIVLAVLMPDAIGPALLIAIPIVVCGVGWLAFWARLTQ